MSEKEREESIEERKARMNEYLVNQELSRLKGIVECLVEVGQDLEYIVDSNAIRKKPVFQIIEELLLGADKKYQHLLNKKPFGSEDEADYRGRSQGYKAMLEIIQGVIRISGYR